MQVRKFAVVRAGEDQVSSAGVTVKPSGGYILEMKVLASLVNWI